MFELGNCGLIHVQDLREFLRCQTHRSVGFHALVGVRFRKLSSEYTEHLPPQVGNVAGGGIPEDLPIQIKIGVHDPVPHGYNLPPGYLRVAISQRDRQTGNGLAGYGQVIQYGRRQNFVFQE